MFAGIVIRKYGYRVVPISIVVFGILTIVRRPAPPPPARAGRLVLTLSLLMQGFGFLGNR